MNVGYGFRRTEKALKEAGADKVWIDLSKERGERTAMVRDGGVRRGDTLILLSERDLGGSPKADAMWRERIEALGVKIEVREPPPDQKKIRGRPKRFAPSPEQDKEIRGLWLCWHYTEAYKLRRVAEIMGHEVGRGVLFNRYGSMQNPRKDRGDV